MEASYKVCNASFPKGSELRASIFALAFVCLTDRLHLLVFVDCSTRFHGPFGLFSRHIRPGTKIVSNSFAAYLRIKDMPFRPKCTHEMVHQQEEFVTTAGYHTNNIEATWRTR